jgi:hypothetical protein
MLGLTKKIAKIAEKYIFAGRLRELALALVTFNNKNILFFSTLRLALSYLINQIIFSLSHSSEQIFKIFKTMGVVYSAAKVVIASRNFYAVATIATK